MASYKIRKIFHVVMIVLLFTLFIGLNSVKSFAQTVEYTDITDFGYDVTNDVKILGGWVDTNDKSSAHGTASSEQVLNKNLYSSVTSLKVTNGGIFHYLIDSTHTGVKSFNLNVFAHVNSNSETATGSYVVNLYGASDNLLLSTEAQTIAKKVISSAYKGRTDELLSNETYKTSVSLQATEEIKKIEMVFSSSGNIIIARASLSYNRDITYADSFVQEITQGSLKLNYQTNRGIVSFNEQLTAIRFGATISKTLYDGLKSLDSNLEFGVIASKSKKLGSAILTYENATLKKSINPSRVDAPGASVESEVGEYYQFALLLTDIPSTDYTVSVTARCYVLVNGTYFYMESATYSLATLANKYLENYNNNVTGFEICQGHTSALNHLSLLLTLEPQVFIYYIDLEGAPGDAALIKIGDTDILVDAGDDDATSKANVLEFLNTHVIDNTIEYVIATHPDADHIDGMKNVFDNFVVEAVFKYSTNKTSETFDSIISAEANCIVYMIADWLGGSNKKSLIINEDVYLEFYDTGYLESETTNASSIVFTLNAYDVRALFSGDAEEAQEKVYAPLCGDVDIYSMGHHGSSNATSLSALQNMKPEIIIAQVGDRLGNKHKHPTIAAMTRVYDYNQEIMIYCLAGEGTDDITNRNGTITIGIGTLGYEVSSEFFNDTPLEMRATDYWKTNYTG